MDSNLEEDDYWLPPMLIQPYVENALVHGLMTKSNAGEINIDFQLNKDSIKCTVIDDGIGRKKALERKKSNINTHNKSFGMSITQARLDILNSVEKKNFEVNITDLKSKGGAAAGTKVEIIVPADLNT